MSTRPSALVGRLQLVTFTAVVGCPKPVGGHADPTSITSVCGLSTATTLVPISTMEVPLLQSVRLGGVRTPALRPGALSLLGQRRSNIAVLTAVIAKVVVVREDSTLGHSPRATTALQSARTARCALVHIPTTSTRHIQLVNGAAAPRPRARTTVDKVCESQSQQQMPG